MTPLDVIRWALAGAVAVVVVGIALAVVVGLVREAGKR